MDTCPHCEIITKNFAAFSHDEIYPQLVDRKTFEQHIDSCPAKRSYFEVKKNYHGRPILQLSNLWSVEQPQWAIHVKRLLKVGLREHEIYCSNSSLCWQHVLVNYFYVSVKETIDRISYKSDIYDAIPLIYLLCQNKDLEAQAVSLMLLGQFNTAEEKLNALIELASSFYGNTYEEEYLKAVQTYSLTI